MASSDDEVNPIDTGSGDDEDVEDEDVYEVERVLEMKMKRGKREYLVKWIGYSEEYNSWEPEDNLGGAQDAVDAFLAANPPSDKSGSDKKQGGPKKRGSGAQSFATKSSKSKSKTEVKEDEDDHEEAEEQSDDDESADEFAPAKAKRKKKEETGKRGKKKSASDAKAASTSTGKNRRSTSTSRPRKMEDSLVRGIKIEQKQIKREGPPNTSTPIGQTKALNSRIAMSKNAAFSWLDSDGDDDSGSEKGAEGESKGKGGGIAGDDNKEKAKLREGSNVGAEGKQKRSKKDGSQPSDKTDDDVDSPPPPIDPTLGNGHNHTNSTINMEEAFSEHDPAKDLNIASRRTGRRSNSISSSGTVAAKINGTTKNRGEHSGTSTPLDNGNNGPVNTARSTRSDRKNKAIPPPQRVETSNKKEASKVAAPALSIDTIFRRGKNLMVVANIGTQAQVVRQISAGCERQIVEILKNEEAMHGDR